jgi:anoctamin-10
LHNEVINLEGDAGIAAAVAASNRRRMIRLQQRAVDGIDEESSLSDVSAHHVAQLQQLQIDPNAAMDDDSLYNLTLEGMEIGGAMSPPLGLHRSVSPSMYSQHHRRHEENGPVFSWGIAAEYISLMRRRAHQLSLETKIKVGAIKTQTAAMSQKVLHYYRPPLSPRSRELKDLEYLQQSHKEKVGRLKNEDEMDTDNVFLDDENFCDFVLILTPQEVYRYWAHLLDFREEHLGMMDSVDMWSERLEIPSDSASITETTDSRTTDEEEFIEEVSGGLNGCSNDEESTDLHTEFPAEYSIPMTGLLRRRGRTSPGNNKTPSQDVALNQSIYSTSNRSQRTGQLTRQSRSFLHSPGTATKRGTRMSMFERAVLSPMLSNSGRQRLVSQDYSLSTYTISEHGEDGVMETPNTGVPSFSTFRRRWGNHTMPSSAANILSPPVRSLTRGTGSVSKIMLGAATTTGKKASRNSVVTKTGPTYAEDEENQDPNCIQSEEELHNPIIPRGILVRTNGMLQFLSALKRGIVLRRHRANQEAIFCKIFSNDGGDTIQYHFVDPEEAMVAFKEQRVRYNRKKLTHSSSPSKIRAISREWSCMDGPADGSPVHKFKVPDHVAAQKYREKLIREHGVGKRLFEIATKAANSGMIRTADLVAVHPAYHLDPRHPGVRKGELGTASLRRSLSDYHTPHTFSLVTTVRQRLKKGGPGVYKYSKEAEDKWYKGEGSELQYKILDLEVATEGEFWLILRGFLHLHRDAAANRFAANRSAGIGGGFRLSADSTDDEGGVDNIESRLQRDAFLEPKTVGRIEKLIVKARKQDDTYLRGAIMPGAIPPPSDYFLGFKSPGTQIWSRLRLAGLETQRVYAIDTRRVMIKVRCPEDRLTDVAEVLRLKMETIDGHFAPFREDTAHLFKPHGDMLDVPALYQGRMASLLRSKDRQMIIDFIIGSRIRDSGAELGQRSDVGKLIQARVPLHMPRKLDSLCDAWVYFWKREHWIGGSDQESATSKGVTESSDGSRLSIEEGSPPEKPKAEDRQDKDDRPIPSFLTRFFVEAFNQPLDAVEDYFGEQVTFYFAFLQHCAIHLLFLSVFGVIMALCQVTTDNFDHPLRPFYAMLVMFWTFLVLVNWRKRSNYLAYRWGSMDHKVQETTRPEFHGEYVIDPITNEWEIKYPKWKRWLKYLISVPITVFFTVFVLLLILLVHANRDKQMAMYVEQRTNPNSDPYQFELKLENIGHDQIIGEVELTRDLLFDPTYWVIMAALPAMLGLCIPILNFILMKISVMLNDFENYRTESEYRTHLIIKVFSFRFVSQFGTVYYYASISTGSKQAIENGIIRMGTSVMVYTTVAHWWNIFLQVYFFMFIRYIRRHLYQRQLREELKNIELLEEDHVNTKRSDAEAREIRLINKRMLLDQAQDDLWFEVMNPPHDSFPEYVQAVVQFSFVSCFSVVLPITPLLVLFNYLLSMRFDAYKLCRGRRRPLAKRTGGIGVWEHLLHIVAVIAVLTNCWLIAFTNSDFEWLRDEVGEIATVAIVVAWEHSMLLIKYTMTNTISPFPKEIRDEMKRKQHGIEQERYATMRLKKEQSRRTNKYRKSLSAEFKRVDDESSSQGGSEISHEHHETNSALYLDKTPDFRRRLTTINSSDESSSSQPGELYEC